MGCTLWEFVLMNDQGLQQLLDYKLIIKNDESSTQLTKGQHVR